MVQESPTELNDRAREAWQRNAEFWDARIGEGNRFNLELIRPAIQRLLGSVEGATVLDVGCGNGQISRWLADLGATVVAFDFSTSFIELAINRSDAYAGRIDYHTLDGTDETALLGLGPARFDAVVASMVLMDMADIMPLISAARSLLRPEGSFVFAVTHPCFNTSYASFTAERIEGDKGDPRTEFSVRVRRYKTIRVSRGMAILGQPVPQFYFNRTLAELFESFFSRGFVLDGLEEPAFEGAPEGDQPAWRNLTEIPPVLVARMRPAR
jgi:2-polyprenyl-3-methyl-5-hydroxy-6-metoxy-1,4-benzoquinol methylase